MTIEYLLSKKIIVSKKKLLKVLTRFFEHSEGILFTYFNQNSFNIFYSNKKYREVLEHFNVYQEGIGMYIALRFLGIREVERIDSTEMHMEIINKLISNNMSISFIGGNFKEEEIKKRAKKAGLEIEFYHNGFFSEDKINYLIDCLEKTKSNYIIIGMGTPVQELLAYKLSKKIHDKAILCVGNFMNYFLAYKSRAPEFLRKLQLEWFYRLLQEPVRLFRRYIIGIPLFLWRIFKLKVKYFKLLT